MLKHQVGKDFLRAPEDRFDPADDGIRNPIRVLVVDPVLGSRFSLVQAASQPGFLVDASASAREARVQLARVRYSVVVVDNALEGATALDWLADLRTSHPDMLRVLVSAQAGLEFKRNAIERAGLSLLLTKPFTAESLRRNLRELLGSEFALAGWTHLFAEKDPQSSTGTSSSADFASERRHEIVLRGLLAGLNSCEVESEVYELMHSELAETLRITRWLWLDEETGRVTRVEGDWPIHDGLTRENLFPDEASLLAQAQRSARVTRLDEEDAPAESPSSSLAFLSLAIRLGRQRTNTCVISLDRRSAASAASLLRELQCGLEMALRRIREADRRALCARNLARRVSEELRTPVGALTHAIDRLRGEAERAGISSEWFDQVSSESQRVIRAVEHLEGEMLAEPMRVSFATN